MTMASSKFTHSPEALHPGRADVVEGGRGPCGVVRVIEVAGRTKDRIELEYVGCVVEMVVQ